MVNSGVCSRTKLLQGQSTLGATERVETRLKQVLVLHLLWDIMLPVAICILKCCFCSSNKQQFDICGHAGRLSG